MNQDTFIKLISEKSNIDKNTSIKILKSIINIIQTSLENHDTITLQNLCKFETVLKKEKIGVNPKTGEKLTIPEHYGIKISTLPSFKKKIKNIKV